jgi:hypothetical protein
MPCSAFIYIAVLSLITLSCGSSTKNATEKNREGSPNQSNMKQDSIDYDSIPTPSPPLPGLPPNETRIRGKMIAIQQAEDRGMILTFEVINFLGSGSSAPVVMPRDTLTVKAPELQQRLKKGAWYMVDLEYRQVLAKYKESASPWLLISIEKSSKPQP